MRRASSTLLVLALLGAACTDVTPLVITGETLDAAGNQFADIAPVIDAGVAQGKISPERYAQWTAFGLRFQASYRLLQRLWVNARQVNDAALEQQTAQALGKMLGELGSFIALAQQIAHPDGGPDVR